MRVEPEGHRPIVLTAGQAFIEVLNTWHTATNPGTTPTKFYTFFWGEQGKPLTVNP